MKKILINSPIMSASGYGEMARFALRSLRQHEDKFDIYLNVLNWGQTGFIFDENEEYEYIKSLRIKSEQYFNQSGGKPHFDVSLQITIPNEWKRMAPVNIGYTAGIETTHISPAWLEPSNAMDKIIVISEHAKNVFQNTAFQDDKGNQFRVSTPIEVVHFPFPEKAEGAKLELDLPCEFNFLTVNQWGPRKNMEQLIVAFVEEFRDEDVGLVIKTNAASDSQIDKNLIDQRLQALLTGKGDRKCHIHLLHGRMTDSEMNALYRHPKIGAFVTATHGEGFGLPIFEAVGAELPVVATDWSGHLDFLTMPDEGGKDKKMFARVDCEIKAIEQGHVWPGVMEAGTSWAYPLASSLKSRMREVMKDRSRFKSWAKKLATHNKTKFSEQIVCDNFFYSLGLFTRPKVLEVKPITGLSFCIPTNGKRIEKTRLTINSIKKQNWGKIPYEINICGDVELFKEFEGVNLIDQKDAAHTRKVALLRNKAAEAAKYDIVFCDDDVILSQDWLEKTVNFSNEKGWEILGNKILNPDGTRHWDRGLLNPRILVDYLYNSNDKNLMQTSGFFLIRKEIFTINKWDDTKLVYADRLEQKVPEDVKFNLDLHNKNILISFNKEAVVWHNDDSYSSLKIGNYEQTLTKEMIKNYNKNIDFLDHHPGFKKLVGN